MLQTPAFSQKVFLRVTEQIFIYSKFIHKLIYDHTHVQSKFINSHCHK